MRTGALVLGIIGGISGIISSALAFVVGGMGGFFDAEGADTVVGLGWSALFFLPRRACWCGTGTIVRPVAAAVLMLISAIGVTISISLFAVIAAPLFFVGALLAFLGSREGRNGH